LFIIFNCLEFNQMNSFFIFLNQNAQQVINIDKGIMSVFLILISILLFSCEESKKVKSNFTENERIKVNDSLPLLKDFLLLEDELLQKDLFKKIDSVSAIHYPMHKKKDIVNITPKMLGRYLYDINQLDLKDSVISYDITKKEYYHKIIHRDMQKYKTSDYKNIIYVETYPNKTFRLVINYSYTVQFEKSEEPISVESSISYSFKIINRKIKEFDIQESG